jgi:hypothetical protein
MLANYWKRSGEGAPLIGTARRCAFDDRCIVTGVFDAGETFGFMRQVEVGAGADTESIRSRCKIADYRRRRA